MTEFSLSEKVGTIFDCYMRSGTREGSFGSIRDCGAGIYRINVDGGEFTVQRWIGRWSVSHRGFEGLGQTVEDAAYLALDQFRSITNPTPSSRPAAHVQ